MNIIQSLTLGVVEGITEFLPISSTFHLIFATKFLGLTQTDFNKLFEVFIQSGAIVSVLLLYFTDVVKDKDLMKKVLVSFIPTAIIGFALQKVIKDVFFESSYLMLTVFFVVGAIFIVSEYLIKSDKLKLANHLKSLSYKEAIIIGVIQSFAVIPGVSRSGAVILGMMYLRYRRTDAARYSFILSIPTIFAASALDLFKMRSIILSHSNNALLLVVGFAAAFISSYFVVKWLIRYLQNHTLAIFGYYRFILGALILWSMLKK
jgi:undecaprenyl-diphosphatase